MIPQFYGRLEEAKFHLNRKQVWTAYLKSLSDGEYYLELHKAKGPSKTNEQMAYYYAVILPMTFEAMRALGNDKIIIKVGKKFIEVPLTEEICDYLLKEKHAPRDENGKMITKRDMTKEEASEFIDTVIRWDAEMLGIVIPDADQEWWRK